MEMYNLIKRMQIPFVDADTSQSVPNHSINSSRGNFIIQQTVLSSICGQTHRPPLPADECSNRLLLHMPENTDERIPMRRSTLVVRSFIPEEVRECRNKVLLKRDVIHNQMTKVTPHMRFCSSTSTFK
jgi:hypothetical protein